MPFSYLSAQIVGQLDRSSMPDMRLRGRALILAQLVWATLVVLALLLFLISIPALYLQLSRPPEALRESLTQAGLSIGIYAVYLDAINVVFGLGSFVVAALIVWRKSDSTIALFVSLLLVLLGAVNGGNAS